MSIWFDFLKHILSFFVIIQHSPSVTRYSPELNSNISNLIRFVDFAVTCFFVLSGYLSGRKSISLADTNGLAKRLLIPYVLFSFVNIIFLSFAGKSNGINDFYRIFNFQGIGPQLYFLPYMFFIVVVVLWIERVTSAFVKPTVLLFILSTALLMMSSYFPTKDVTGPNYLLISFYMASYIVGRLSFKLINSSFFVGFSILIFAATLVLYFLFDDRRFFCLFISYALLLLVIYAGHIFPIGGRIMGSGAVYLLHTPILNHTISTILMRFNVISEANFLMSLVLTYAISMLFYNIALKNNDAIKIYFLE